MSVVSNLLLSQLVCVEPAKVFSILTPANHAAKDANFEATTTTTTTILVAD